MHGGRGIMSRGNFRNGDSSAREFCWGDVSTTRRGVWAPWCLAGGDGWANVRASTWLMASRTSYLETMLARLGAGRRHDIGDFWRPQLGFWRFGSSFPLFLVESLMYAPLIEFSVWLSRDPVSDRLFLESRRGAGLSCERKRSCSVSGFEIVSVEGPRPSERVDVVMVQSEINTWLLVAVAASV
jgi:hypothetical protein